MCELMNAIADSQYKVNQTREGFFEVRHWEGLCKPVIDAMFRTNAEANLYILRKLGLAK